MTTLRWWRVAMCAAVLCAAGGAAAGSAEPVEIMYRWPKGERIVYRMVQETTVRTEGAGQPRMEMEQSQTMVYSLRVEDVAADGAATVRTTYDSMRVSMTMPMTGEMVYDSEDADADTGGNPMAQAMAAMVGESVTMVLTPRGEVRSVEGISEIFDRLGAELGHAAVPELLKDTMGDEQMKRMMEQWLRMWPNEAVSPGETWEVRLEHPLPMLGTLASVSTMTLHEVVDRDGFRAARIGMTMRMSMTPAGEGAADRVPGIEISMEGGTGSGEVEFDLDRGQLARMSMEMSMPMRIRMDAMGEEIVMAQDTSSRVVMERIKRERVGGE